MSTNQTSKIIIKIFLGLSVLLVLGNCKNMNAGGNASSSRHIESKLGWKLGSQAYTFKFYSFAEALKKIDSCNLRYVEGYPSQQIGGGIAGVMSPDMDMVKRKAVLKMLEDNNIKMLAFGVTHPTSEAEWIKLFDFSKSMGIETLTAEPNEKDIPLVSKLADKYKINVAIHNHPKPSHYWDPDVVLNAIKGQSKRLGACADIGHWVRSGLDPVECLKKLEGHIMHLHMKDLHVKGKEGHDVHWGEGVNNIPGVIAELKRQNFKGMISAEYEYNWQGNSSDVAQSVVNFRNLVGKIN